MITESFDAAETRAFLQLCKQLDLGQPVATLVRSSAFRSLRTKFARMTEIRKPPPKTERCRCMVCGNEARCAAIDHYSELREQLQLATGTEAS